MTSLAARLADLLSGDTARAEAAAAALHTDGEAAFAALLPLLKHENEDTRWWAIRALAGFNSPAASEQLTAALGDASASVQQCAALALSQRLWAPSVSPLAALLASRDGLLARLAGDALVAQGSEAVPALIAVLEGSMPAAGVEAARALALIGDTRAIPALFKLLDSESALLEHWASEGLQKMGVSMAFFKP
ncbi:MAG TPA: HEAT repeat domain-containing protein [Anaerolineales bacterium]|nr:HEAT repeat domain-containing protein [Anaerolineales bacterium]HRQ92921.1 HEAT repeat domain-containing protein [Anaerolineales bacterium]